jgi:hypothetical protein
VKRTGFALRKAEPRARAEVPVYRPKGCKVCKAKFTPTRQIQPTCGFECHIKYADRVLAQSKAKLAQADRKADKAKRESLKTRSDYIKEAQREFNRYIRFRDRHLPCICCDKPLGANPVGGLFDCGHYRSVGSAPHLRFHEDNAHAQLKQCNRYGAGRAVDYRLGLLRRLGVARVDALEADQAPRHYSIDDLKAIKTKYRALARQLEKQG